MPSNSRASVSFLKSSSKEMNNKLAVELCSESLQLPNLNLGHSSTADGFNEADIQAEDGSLWGDSDEELDKASDLDGEWQTRHDQFHTNELREIMIETQGKRDKFQELYESVNSLSSSDALKLFHDDILTKKAVKQSEPAEAGVSVGGSQEQSSNYGSLGTDTAELQSLLFASPEIKVQFFHQEDSTPDLC